jgi:hypothetical protein
MHTFTFLRRALVADGAISGATGLVMLAGAGMLEPLLGIPAALMRIAGIILLPFAGMVLYFARQSDIPRANVATVIGLNAGWVGASVLLLVSGWIAPTWLGTAFVMFQAVVVGAFAELQYAALRRSRGQGADIRQRPTPRNHGPEGLPHNVHDSTLKL